METVPSNSTACLPPRADGSQRADSAAPATLRVHLFAGMAEAAGARDLAIAWTGGTVGGLRAAIAAACPPIVALLTRSAIAIDGRYATDASAVPATADVAVIPPVSGG